MVWPELRNCMKPMVVAPATRPERRGRRPRASGPPSRAGGAQRRPERKGREHQEAEHQRARDVDHAEVPRLHRQRRQERQAVGPGRLDLAGGAAQLCGVGLCGSMAEVRVLISVALPAVWATSSARAISRRMLVPLKASPSGPSAARSSSKPACASRSASVAWTDHGWRSGPLTDRPFSAACGRPRRRRRGPR